MIKKTIPQLQCTRCLGLIGPCDFVVQAAPAIQPFARQRPQIERHHAIDWPMRWRVSRYRSLRRFPLSHFQK